MNLRRRFRFWLLILLQISFAGVTVATEQFWLLLVAGPTTVLGWYLVEGPRSRSLPPLGVNIGAILLLGLIGLSFSAEPDPGRTMELLSLFVLGLIVLRQLQERSPREDAQQIILSLILVLSATMQSEQLLFGIIVLAWCTTALHVVVLYQIYKGTDAARRVRGQAPAETGQVIPPLTARFGPQDLRSARRIALVSMAGVTIFSIVIFVIFPRDILFNPRIQGPGAGARSGFSKDVDLVSSQRISESRREVFTLKWKDARGVPIRWRDPILLRGSVLERYLPSIGKWSSDDAENRRARRNVVPNLDGSFASLGRSDVEDRIQTFTVEVTMRSLTGNVVFAPWAPIALAATEGRTFEFNTRTLLMRDVGVDTIGSYWSYRLKVQPFPTNRALESLLGEAAPVPDDIDFPVPRIREIALRILGERNVDLEVRADETAWQRNTRIASELMRWLELNCRYSTDLGDFIQVVGEDPIVSFLETYRFGHCEYFASALTAMCQSLGIESRLLTGFIAMEYDESTATYVVRESNAHAWCEVRSGEYQWKSFDPSPDNQLMEIQSRNRSWADSWRWVYDRLDFLWNSSVVGFDTRTQVMLAKRASGGWDDSVRRLLDSGVERIRSFNRFFRLGPAGYIWLLSIALIALSFVVVGIALIRRRRKVVRLARLSESDSSRVRRLARQLSFWVDALSVLERRGIIKAGNETPLAFCRRVSDSDPESGASLRNLVDLLYRIRFGGHEPTAVDLERADELVRVLKGASGR